MFLAIIPQAEFCQAQFRMSAPLRWALSSHSGHQPTQSPNQKILKGTLEQEHYFEIIGKLRQISCLLYWNRYVHIKKYRNAEYTAAACKFWGGKKIFGV